MSRKATQLYDFSIAAGESFDLPVDANFYKVLTSTGDLAITRDGGSTVRPMRAGRGERNIEFKKLVLRDISGATNSGTILVGDSGFIDDTIVLSSSINVRPEAASGFYNVTSALAANTADVIFLPGANTGGAIVMQATIGDAQAVAHAEAILAKASAPASVNDGEAIVLAVPVNSALSNPTATRGDLMIPQYVAAGKGLYYIGSTVNSNQYPRVCRYKLL